MIRLAQTRSFRARWTADIQREWVTALLRAPPALDEARLGGTVALMNKAVPVPVDVTEEEEIASG